MRARVLICLMAALSLQPDSVKAQARARPDTIWKAAVIPAAKAPMSLPVTPAIHGSALRVDLLATFRVDPSGRADVSSLQLTGTFADLANIRSIIGAYIAAIQFAPATRGGKPVGDTLQIRYVRRLGSLDQTALPQVYCADCDATLERMRKRLLQLGERATDCARAFREIARTVPTDTLAWVPSVLTGCEGADMGGAVAVRLMVVGHNSDTTHALRAEIASITNSRDVLDAAFGVLANGDSHARVFALQLLDRVALHTPRALGALTKSADVKGCGPYVVDGLAPYSEDTRSAYLPSIRILVSRIVGDPTQALVVRKAAQCVLDGIPN